MSGYLVFKGLGKMRQRVADLAKGLRAAASGVVIERSAAKVRTLVATVAEKWIGRHTDTGAAAASLVAAASGSLVTVTANGYLRFQRWPFSKGMPRFILRQASIIMARELMALIGSKGAAGQLALEVVNEADIGAANAATRRTENKVKAAQRRAAARAAKVAAHG